MIKDQFSQIILEENDIINHLMTNPEHKLTSGLTKGVDVSMVNEILDNVTEFIEYQPTDIDIKTFDHQNQTKWLMPVWYKELDIAAWILTQCQTQEQLQRCGNELIMFQERDLFDLLRYLKYLVDTMRENNIIWGVGRGSSVASYVLFLIGIHRIDSMFYNLSIDEFLR